ncbi:hypothetical protein CR162_21360 [Pseudoroseomonas rhizosphaerae]|uniref:Uncharacterized protein n=1 Tax=Teichococcus rhizosphaerae TaxID=1335062 RepID=A0A2C6Z323_9PROT|nr:hypothetical protein [Pseudoroseomonas rhizosphaerae]PHK92921.1 hypothetical protein CR162_21360 [Pseudoroseomonas rhizosphaerae]
MTSQPPEDLKLSPEDAQIKAITDDMNLRMCLHLVKNGVPWDVAFSLDEIEVRAFVMIFGFLDGHDWDWEASCWKKKGD